MSRPNLPSLAELRKRRSERRQDEAGLDDEALFRAAMKDVAALPVSNHADIARQAPAPLPRPRAADGTAAMQAASISKDDFSKNELSLPAHWFADGDKVQTPDDALIARSLAGITPLQTDRVHLESPKPRPVPIQHARDEQAALEESIYAPTPLELVLEGGDELHYLRDGMPRSLLRDLRRGRWVVQAELDLHGANREEARDLLATAFADWRKRDVRCVRIIHGKGLGSPGKEPVLKKLVAGWLMNYDDVLAYAQARVHDGGAGALIVLMRANRR